MKKEQYLESIEDLMQIIDEERDEKVKARCWTFIVYPESAPVDWIDRLEELFVQFAISPLHCLDLNEDGTQKKPHYHVMLAFDGPATYNQARTISADLTNGTPPFRVHSARAMIQYFCHINNPDKVRYDEQDIRSFHGLDIESLLLKADSYYRHVSDLIDDYVLNHKIDEYSDLLILCKQHDQTSMEPDWTYCVKHKYTNHYKLLVNSIRNSNTVSKAEKRLNEKIEQIENEISNKLKALNQLQIDIDRKLG